MQQSFVIDIQQQYADARISTRLPPAISYRMAYAEHQTWHMDNSWYSLQWHDAKHVFLYCIEIEAKEVLYLPIEVLFTDIHWQYALKGGYSLSQAGVSVPILQVGQQHKIYGERGSFVVEVTIGRHLLIGFNIASDWLSRYSELLKIHPSDLSVALLPDKLYQTSPGNITDAMQAELLLLLGLPSSEHLHQDVSIYQPVSKLLELNLQQETAVETCSKSPIQEKVLAIHQYIAACLSHHQAVTPIHEIALHFGINSDYLNRVHKAITGCNLQSYIRSKTLERSAQMLRNGYPISEVAFRLGYSDSSAFSKAFKKRYGISPSQICPDV
jgi:AraC-like DNA-binding protein